VALTRPLHHEIIVIDEPRKLVQRLARTAEAAIVARGQFRVALAGGSSPRPAYEMLAADRSIDWSKWHIFFSDERCVPPHDPRSNYRMVEEALLSRIGIVTAKVHRMQGELDPNEAAEAYEAELGHEPLDVALLGIGDDGHTASLFPGTPVLEERSRLVAPSMAPVEPKQRLTLTFRAIDEARCAWFVVSGEGKAAVLAEVIVERERARPRLPAARVAAQSVEFYVDSAAAAQLP
jgi:6-phosphogluconolactonase